MFKIIETDLNTLHFCNIFIRKLYKWFTHRAYIHLLEGISITSTTTYYIHLYLYIPSERYIKLYQ